MNDTIIVAIIGGLSTIIAPIITWFFTSRSKEKEKQYALDSMKKIMRMKLTKYGYNMNTT